MKFLFAQYIYFHCINFRLTFMFSYIKFVVYVFILVTSKFIMPILEVF